jgi:hypothetical protein
MPNNLKEYNKYYYNKNKERLQQINKEYYYNHQEELKEYNLNYYYNNPSQKEINRVYSNNYYHNNKERINLQRKIKYHQNKRAPTKRPKHNKIKKPFLQSPISKHIFTDDGKILLQF